MREPFGKLNRRVVVKPPLPSRKKWTTTQPASKFIFYRFMAGMVLFIVLAGFALG
jgi:hypothetical protein